MMGVKIISSLTGTNYGWLITEDHVGGKVPKAAWVAVGPSAVPDDIVERLEAGEGKPFRLVDGDGHVHYEGRIIIAPEDEGGSVLFKPLDQWGTPQAGSTAIQYKDDETGEWTDL